MDAMDTIFNACLLFSGVNVSSCYCFMCIFVFVLFTSVPRFVYENRFLFFFFSSMDVPSILYEGIFVLRASTRQKPLFELRLWDVQIVRQYYNEPCTTHILCKLAKDRKTCEKSITDQTTRPFSVGIKVVCYVVLCYIVQFIYLMNNFLALWNKNKQHGPRKW